MIAITRFSKNLANGRFSQSESKLRCNLITPKFAFCANVLIRGDESCLKVGGGGGHKICSVQNVQCTHQFNVFSHNSDLSDITGSFNNNVQLN